MLMCFVDVIITVLLKAKSKFIAEIMNVTHKVHTESLHFFE